MKKIKKNQKKYSFFHVKVIVLRSITLNGLINNRRYKRHTYVEKLLSSKIGNSKKSINETIFTKYYLPNIDIAIKNATAFSEDIEILIDNIGTRLPRLIAKMRDNVN